METQAKRDINWKIKRKICVKNSKKFAENQQKQKQQKVSASFALSHFYSLFLVSLSLSHMLANCPADMQQPEFRYTGCANTYMWRSHSLSPPQSPPTIHSYALSLSHSLICVSSPKGCHLSSCQIAQSTCVG